VRWPQRKDLLRTALARFWQAYSRALTDTGSLRDDAVAFLRNADVNRARRTAWCTVLLPVAESTVRPVPPRHLHDPARIVRRIHSRDRGRCLAVVAGV